MVKPEQAARNVANQNVDPRPPCPFYRRMIVLRKARPQLRQGKTHFVDMPHRLLGFWRGDTVFCLFNLSDQTQIAHLARTGSVLLAEDAEVQERQMVLKPLGFNMIEGKNRSEC